MTLKRLGPRQILEAVDQTSGAQLGSRQVFLNPTARSFQGSPRRGRLRREFEVGAGLEEQVGIRVQSVFDSIPDVTLLRT